MSDRLKKSVFKRILPFTLALGLGIACGYFMLPRQKGVRLPLKVSANGEVHCPVWILKRRGDRRKVILSGELHYASDGFFTRMQDIMSRADIVLYEGLSDLKPGAEKTEMEKKIGYDYFLRHVSGLPGYLNVDWSTSKLSGEVEHDPILSGALLTRPGNSHDPAVVRRAIAEKIGKGAVKVPSREQVIVKRNRLVWRELEKQFARGKKTVGLRYGAAHAEDFLRRLEKAGFVQETFFMVKAWEF